MLLKIEIKIKGEPRVYYNLRRYKKMGCFGILTDIGKYVTPAQLMEYLVNANHDISVVGY